MRIPPFHSVQAPWVFYGVYHDNDQCIAGAAIHESERTTGKGECRECAECAVLNAQDGRRPPEVMERVPSRPSSRAIVAG